MLGGGDGGSWSDFEPDQILFIGDRAELMAVKVTELGAIDLHVEMVVDGVTC